MRWFNIDSNDLLVPEEPKQYKITYDVVSIEYTYNVTLTSGQSFLCVAETDSIVIDKVEQLLYKNYINLLPLRFQHFESVSGDIIPNWQGNVEYLSNFKITGTINSEECYLKIV